MPAAQSPAARTVNAIRHPPPDSLIRPIGSIKSGVVALAGANAQNPQDVGDENLAIAHLPCFRSADDGLHYLIDQFVLDGDFDAGLRHKVHDVLCAAVQLGMSALPPESLDLGHRHAGDADFGQRRAHVIQLEGFDDRGNQFHSRLRSGAVWVILLRFPWGYT